MTVDVCNVRFHYLEETSVFYRKPLLFPPRFIEVLVIHLLEHAGVWVMCWFGTDEGVVCDLVGCDILDGNVSPEVGVIALDKLAVGMSCYGTNDAPS